MRIVPRPRGDRYNVVQFRKSTQALSVEQWETFYRGGLVATCPTSADGGYDLEVRDAWVAFFSTLADGARILDVGTGNGAVAMIAAETAMETGRHWEIHGTDLAQINPMRDVPDAARRLAGITFHPGVPTERLPFEAESFDAVSGQYALEYTDTAAAFAEIHRVMKPGGNAQFIVHHADSMLVKSAQLSLEDGELVLGQTKIFRRLHKLVTMENAVPGTIERVTAELRDAIHALKAALQTRQQLMGPGAGHTLNVSLDAVQKLLSARNVMRPDAVGLDVDKVEGNVRASMRRLNDLMDYARSEQDMQGIEKAAAEAGFVHIERLPQYHGGANLVGWQLLLHRA
jgi:ubiquinone/menaquinone biosynthesis C-methylase UbiE